jgi:phosphoribosyl-ATP pyrophosphohydrolase/phosphoribosyl-AMP cyclohydrolase
MLDISKVNWSKDGSGLIPVVVQDYKSLQVLMVAFMNEESLKITLDTKKVTFWSRTRNRLWTKGETSGNFLNLIDISLDCDNDAILVYVDAEGPTCHTGNTSCFYEMKYKPSLMCITSLMKTILDRKINPLNESYTNKLFDSGIKRIAQKVGEEGVEVALAAVTGDNEELANEVADLIFHLLVLLESKNLKFEKVTDILYSRVGERKK